MKQVAEEFALAMNESLPIPEQCQHQFSEELERKMQRLLSAVPINTQIAVAAPELSYNQTYELQCNNTDYSDTDPFLSGRELTGNDSFTAIYRR